MEDVGSLRKRKEAKGVRGGKSRSWGFKGQNEKESLGGGLRRRDKTRRSEGERGGLGAGILRRRGRLGGPEERGKFGWG